MAQKNSNSLAILSSSTTSALFSFASTVLRKALTFTLNLLLVRQVTAETLGGRSDFELVLGSVLFLSREACALVLLRAPVGILLLGEKNSKKGQFNRNIIKRQQFINTAWLPIPIGLVLISIAAIIQYSLLYKQNNIHNTFDTATVIFFMSILIEVFASPFVLLAQALLLAKGRASTDILAELVRCIVVYSLIVYGHSRITALTAFAIGTLSYSIIIIVGFTLSVITDHSVPNIDSLLPRYVQSLDSGLTSQFGIEESNLLKALALNSIFKHILGEGDRFALLLVGSARSERGVYGAVANFGSLAARLIFQPVEESVRTAVSKLVRIGDLDKQTNLIVQSHLQTQPILRGRKRERRGSSIASKKIKDAQQSLIKQKENNSRSNSRIPNSLNVESFSTQVVSELKDSQANLLIAADVFTCVMRVVFFVGLLFMTFGVLYSSAATRLLFFKKQALPGFADQLAAYSIYVFFLALNGVSEAFSTGAANEDRLANASFHLLGAGLITALTAIVTVNRFGVAVGIILANCSNMAARTLSSLFYIASLLRDKGGSESKVKSVLDLLRLVSPSFATLFAFVPAAIACWIGIAMFDDGLSLKGLIISIGIGGISICILLSIAWFFEKKDLLRLVSLLRSKQKHL